MKRAAGIISSLRKIGNIDFIGKLVERAAENIASLGSIGNIASIEKRAAGNIASLGSIGNIASIGKRAAGNVASSVTRRQAGPFFEQSLLIDP